MGGGSGAGKKEGPIGGGSRPRISAESEELVSQM